MKFDALINKFSGEILTALRSRMVTAEIADKAYLNVIRYIPQEKKTLMRRRLLAISMTLLLLKKFELASKYFNQMLLDKSDDFQSLWGLVLCEAGSSNSKELEKSDYNFSETRNYIRAYRAANPKEQDRLNEICKTWSELNDRRKYKPLAESIMKELGVTCEEDIIKSPKLLSTIPEFSQIMQADNEYVVSKWGFLETLQKQFNDLEMQIVGKLKQLQFL